MALISCFCLFPGSVYAEDEAVEEVAISEADGEEGVAKSKAIYLPIKPQFVVNYGGKGRLKYLKVEVSVRLANVRAASAVRRHLPFVRNNILMLFASQTNESVSSQEGKNMIRIKALEEIRKIIAEEEDDVLPEDVVDVFFTSFIVQK
ncbi:MAG: flagellar basal body rod protein [Alteromonadaceae bacterium]|nr:MAG: flagellar basal body rod protein [Alteromonadaceae bacterium]